MKGYKSPSNFPLKEGIKDMLTEINELCEKVMLLADGKLLSKNERSLKAKPLV